MTALETLKQYFGYDAFRHGQAELVADILAAKDVLGIMPTGAGKSVCFQVPALMLPGLTLVVSPLISLMKDQVNALTQAGVAAAFINSSLTERQVQKALVNAANGAYKLIYVAPERLLSKDFLAFAKAAEVSLLTVDEAHCISQWGQDFRPSYTTIPTFISHLNKRPVVSAFTATATPLVQKDIINRLALENPTTLITGFDRQNLYFDVKKPKDKFVALKDFLADKQGLSGIVYCSTRAAVEEVCDKLKNSGYTTVRYHAGLTDYERHTNQDDFLYDRAQIMVATNAFGMGIDKSNVSFVVHYNMPKDLEGYYQEAGRAGRDGEQAFCLLLHGGRDMSTNLWLIENGDTDQLDQQTAAILKERNIKRLQEMALYCETSDCLRNYLLKYFGESPPEHCGNCINCNTSFEVVDITVEAQKIISCVARMKERFGMNMVIDVLRGKKNARLLSFDLDSLSTFGISKQPAHQLSDIINHLILHSYLHKTADKYPIIKLGPKAEQALSPDFMLTMKVSASKNAARDLATPGQVKALGSMKPVNQILLASLKELRLVIAAEQSVPAFVIFHDSSLVDMCIKLPTDTAELLEVSGVGQVKADRYGKRFLQVIKEFMANSAILDDNNPVLELPDFDPAKIEISPEAITVSALADQINCLLLACGYDKISGRRINDWLVAQEHLELAPKGDKFTKVPTTLGAELGIITTERNIRGEDMQINLLNSQAQEYIVANALEILNH